MDVYSFTQLSIQIKFLQILPHFRNNLIFVFGVWCTKWNFLCVMQREIYDSYQLLEIPTSSKVPLFLFWKLISQTFNECYGWIMRALPSCTLLQKLLEIMVYSVTYGPWDRKCWVYATRQSPMVVIQNLVATYVFSLTVKGP